MTLLHLGRYYINFDQVTHIREHAPVPNSAGMFRIEFHDGRHLEISDGYASLKAWLDQVGLVSPVDPAEPLTPPAPLESPENILG